jgi:hypothetical protein
LSFNPDSLELAERLAEDARKEPDGKMAFSSGHFSVIVATSGPWLDVLHALHEEWFPDEPRRDQS